MPGVPALVGVLMALALPSSGAGMVPRAFGGDGSVSICLQGRGSHFGSVIWSEARTWPRSHFKGNLVEGFSLLKVLQ